MNTDMLGLVGLIGLGGLVPMKWPVDPARSGAGVRKLGLLGLGGLQIVLTLALVAGAGGLLGLDWRPAVTTGIILALSSTAIVLQTLSEKGLMATPGGRGAFAVLLTQDLAVIPALALLPLLAIGRPLQAPKPAAEGAEAVQKAMSLI